MTPSSIFFPSSSKLPSQPSLLPPSYRPLQCPTCKQLLLNPITLPCGFNLCQTCLPKPQTIDFQQQIRCPFKSCIRSGVHSPSQFSIDVTLQKLTTSLRTASLESSSLANVLNEDLANDRLHHQPDTLFYGDTKSDPSWNATLEGLYDPYKPTSADTAQISIPPSVIYRNIPIIIETIRSKIQQEIECQVCFLVFDQPITTCCGHTFCKNCLITSLDHKPNCPLCRHELPLYMHYHNQPPNKALMRFIRYLASQDQKLTQDTPQEGREIDPTLTVTPLFISSLVFPGMPCYLLVFEPRYRKLLRNVLKTESKLFGMVLPPRQRKHRDLENMSWEPSMGYGTLLKVRSCELLPDGRALVETIGVSRFQILTYSMMDSYYAATAVELIHDISPEYEIGLEKAALEASSAVSLGSHSDADSHSNADVDDQLSGSGLLLEAQDKPTQPFYDIRSVSTSSSSSSSSSSHLSSLSTLPVSGENLVEQSLASTTNDTLHSSSYELDLKDLHELNLEALSQKELMQILVAFVAHMQDQLGPLGTRRLQR
ncbi:hypothetical protein BGZ46_002111, partial [Entomortierella lignicola]